MTRRVTLLLAAAGTVLAACSMHNRMFYLNQYAGEARRLEREGRRFEANDYWGRASVKAESVLVHRSQGPDAAEALAIRGEAMAALGQCTDALPALSDAMAQLRDATDLEYAALAQGRCYLQLGTPQLAAESVQPVIESRDGSRRDAARLIAGTAWRQLGQDSLALEVLAGNDSREAQLQRAIAAASLGQEQRVNLLMDSLIALRDSTMQWDSVITGVGVRNPVQASHLLDRLAEAKALPHDRMPGLLYADAVRLGSADTAMQQARVAQILEGGATSEYGNRVRIDLALRQVQSASSVGDLKAPLDSLLGIPRGLAGAEAIDTVVPAIETVVMLVDSSGPGLPQSDLRLFLAGEAARDRLKAPRLADSLFEAVVTGWPESPYAGKAWLAARQVSGDTSHMDPRFAESPYVQVLRGGDGGEFAQLEDSLARFASTVHPVTAPGARAPGAPIPGARAPAGAPGATPQPGDSASAGNRVRQPRGRVTEPVQ